MRICHHTDKDSHHRKDGAALGDQWSQTDSEGKREVDCGRSEMFVIRWTVRIVVRSI